MMVCICLESIFFFFCFFIDYFFLFLSLFSFFFFFFFSSRRRHTRSLCDWSSDVCSSDLLRSATGKIPGAALDIAHHISSQIVPGHVPILVLRLAAQSLQDVVEEDTRSEERRVGKECRSRWSRSH